MNFINAMMSSGAMFADTLFNTGDDAINNQFQLTIPTFPGALDVDNTILRVTEFTIPDTSINTYPIEYKTQKITKPAAKNNTANEFTFTFRVDKYWRVYEGFENWLDLILNQNTGAMSPDVSIGSASLIRVPIDIVPVDTNDVVTKTGWTFTGCYPTSLKGAAFTNTGDGSPLTADVTMQFIKKIRRT